MEAPQEVLEDFRNHAYYCFKLLGLGEPTAAQYAMAWAIQTGPQDMQLQAGRGFGKSVILACFASWILLKNPDATIMVVSATSDKAIKFISMVRNILTLVPYCQHMAPGDHTTDNAFGFNVEGRTTQGQDLSCYAKGITSTITGSHADYVFGDDIEVEGNCESPTAQKKIMSKVAEFEQIRNPGMGRVVFLGTPQIRDSMYNQLREGYPVTKFPAEMPDPTIPSEMEDINEWILNLNIEVGEATQPERFPKELLMARKAKIGPRLYALHYKLDTTLADEARYPLRLADLIVMDVNPDICPEKIVWASSTPKKDVPSFGLAGDMVYEPMWISDEWIPYMQTVMFIDPSGRGSDETAICIASFCNGYVHIHKLIGLDGGYDDGTLKKIAKLVLEYKIKHVRFESNFGDGAFGKLLQPFIAKYCGPVAVTEWRATTNKERRILDSLEPVMSQHRLVMDTRTIRDEETQRQITRMQDSRGALAHDDRIDVLAAAVEYFKDALSLDVDTAVYKNANKKQERIYADWMSDARGIAILGDRVSGAVRVTPDRTGMQPKTRANLFDKVRRRKI